MQYNNLIKKIDALKHNIKVFITESYKKIKSLQLPQRYYALLSQLFRKISDKVRLISSGNINPAMNEKPAKQEPAADTNSERIRSVDILRGLVILVMIFVNDAYSIAGAPQIFLHAKYSQDGMTIADIVFPAFLFIVGLSLPFSLGKRLKKWESSLQIWEHIVKRSVVLLFIGFFMVNVGSIDRSNGILEYNFWSFLMLTGVILFRIDFPHSYPWLRQTRKIVRTAGILLLVFLAFAYSSKDGTGLMQMTTQWWGIIGLIGWAYLISAVVYLFMQKLPTGMLGAAALLYCLYLADKAGMFQSFSFINNIVTIGPFLGTHSAICVSGAAMGMLISENLQEKLHKCRITRAIVLGAGFAAGGVMLHSLSSLHPMFKISKLAATPPWGLLSSAFTAWAWALIYLVSDVSKENKITKIMEYAGRNALMAYVLSDLIIYGLTLLDINYFQSKFYAGWGASMGLWRSLFLSVSVMLFAGILEKFKIRLKL
jgi:heparan-alpha-glucosaminide N-acetyltransferase